MPHWINLSFYNKPRRVGGRFPTFVPRIKMPPEIEQFLPEHVDTLTEDYFPRGAPLPQPGKINYFPHVADKHKHASTVGARIPNIRIPNPFEFRTF